MNFNLDSLNDLMYNLKVYFSTLSKNEIYGWIGVGVGVIILLIGLFML